MTLGKSMKRILKSKVSGSVCIELWIPRVIPNRFLRKVLKAAHTQEPRVINVDKSPAYPKAIEQLKHKKELSKQVELRLNKYHYNRIEQDHRFIKRLVKPGMGFGSFDTARRTIKGYEIMNMLRKGQVKKVEKGAVRERVKFIAEIFGLVA